MTTAQDYKYFEVEIGDSHCPSGDTYCICIMGVRKPTVEEAAEFMAADLKEYGCDYVASIIEISLEEACDAYDMENRDTVPVFGLPAGAPARKQTNAK